MQLVNANKEAVNLGDDAIISQGMQKGFRVYNAPTLGLKWENN